VYALLCVTPGQRVALERTVNPCVVGSSPTPGARASPPMFRWNYSAQATPERGWSGGGFANPWWLPPPSPGCCQTVIAALMSGWVGQKYACVPDSVEVTADWAPDSVEVTADWAPDRNVAGPIDRRPRADVTSRHSLPGLTKPSLLQDATTVYEVRSMDRTSSALRRVDRANHC
jgi:hypothetical protein